MKINSKTLLAFINKTSLEGNIQTMNLNFTEDGVISFVQYMNLVMVKSKLKKEAFVDYEAIGEIFIKKTDFLMKVLKTFTGEISLKKEGIVLKIYNNERKFNTILADEVACENVFRKEYDKKDQTNKVIIEKSQLMKAVNDLSLLNEESITFTQEGNIFKFLVGSENSDSSENIIETSGGQDCSFGVGKMIVNYANVVDGLFEMYFGPGMPIRLEERREDIEVTTYIAPINNNGE